MSANSPSIGVNIKGLHYYRNNGTNGNNTFTKISDDFLQADMLDCGQASKPVFEDIDGDGLLDMVVGNDSYKSGTAQQYSDLTVYRNVGTATQPAFSLQSQEYLNIKSVFSPLLISNIHPTFGDIDADGDKDLIIGDFEGHLHWFENTAGVGNPASYQLKQQQFAGIDVGASATPFLLDLSGDSKLDLVVGEQMGNLNYFENTGSSTVPQFSATPTTATLGNIDVHPACCTGYSAPFFFKNSSNKWELLIGTEDGVIWHYDDIDNHLSGTFHQITQQFGGLRVDGRCAIAGADLNNDGFSDWLVGNIRGGLELFTSNNMSTIAPPKTHSFQIYPNPASKQFIIQFLPQSNNLHIDIFNVLGEIIHSQVIENGQTTMEISVKKWAKGMYWIRVGEEWQKMMVGNE